MRVKRSGAGKSDAHAKMSAVRKDEEEEE